MKLSLKIIKKLGLSFLLLGGMQGCYLERDVDVTPSLKAKAHRIGQELFVPVNRNSKNQKLTERERRLLKQYKDQLAPTSPLYAEITLSSSSPKKPAIMQRFAEHVIHFLTEIKIPRDRISVLSKTDKNVPSGIWIRIEQFTVSLPPCPGFDQYVMDGRIPPEGEVTFGCATEANFAKMIAEPRDLYQGQTLEPGDSHQASQAIDRLRTDKTKELKIEKIENAGG